MGWLNDVIGQSLYVKIYDDSDKGQRTLNLTLLSAGEYGILCSSNRDEDSRIFIPWSSIVMVTTDIFV